jgi:hypothetical protein
MIRGFRQIAGRALGPLAVLGLLAATPGCGDGPKKNDAAAGAGAVPSNVQESNKNMENVMKSQKAKK